MYIANSATGGAVKCYVQNICVHYATDAARAIPGLLCTQILCILCTLGISLGGDDYEAVDYQPHPQNYKLLYHFCLNFLS